MFRKLLSVLLAVLMITSVIAVGVASTGAATSADFTPDSKKLYFDVDGTGWTMGSKNKIAFYIFGGDLDTEANSTKPKAWGTKALVGTATAGETGIFEFDPAAKLGTLTAGVQYKIIFVRTDGNNWTDQTYDLFFTTDCLGKVAYCDGTMTENPVDSSKKAATAYWRDMDKKVNGPVLAVSSIGNVVGSCPEQGKDEYDVFVDFITVVSDKTNVTQLANARKFVCDINPSDPKYKTEQKMIDDIGAGLGLTKDQIKKAFDDNPKDKGIVVTPETDPPTYTQEPAAVTTTWSYDDSTLPTGELPTEKPTEAAHDHIAGQPENEVVKEATCGEAGSHNVIVKCTICGQKIESQCQYGVVDPATGEHTKPLKEIEEVPATQITDGVKAHYECETCGKKFTDATGNTEATPEYLRIPALSVQGDADGNMETESVDVTAIQRNVIDIEVPGFNEFSADSDGDEIVDIIDATLIQRVLANITSFDAWNEKHPNKWVAKG